MADNTSTHTRSAVLAASAALGVASQIPAHASAAVSSSQFNIDRHSGLWTVTFSNPPINMFVPETIVELRTLMTELEADPSVKVVVFQSANPDFFIAHFDVFKAAARPEVLGPLARLCAAPLVHVRRKHRQDSWPHARHR